MEFRPDPIQLPIQHLYSTLLVLQRRKYCVTWSHQFSLCHTCLLEHVSQIRNFAKCPLSPPSQWLDKEWRLLPCPCAGATYLSPTPNLHLPKKILSILWKLEDMKSIEGAGTPTFLEKRRKIKCPSYFKLISRFQIQVWTTLWKPFECELGIWLGNGNCMLHSLIKRQCTAFPNFFTLVFRK